MPNKTKIWKIIPSLVLLVAVVAAAIWFIEQQSSKRQSASLKVGGDFAMTDHRGRPVTQADFSDKPMAIFFGYTYCPDVCPTTLSEMAGWVDDLGDQAEQMHFVFVSVDAQRDDQETLASYVDAFFDNLVGLYGTQEQLQTIIKSYRVYAKKNETEGDADDYTIDHTASVYLMDSRNDFIGTIGFGESHDSAVGKLKKLIASNS